MAQEPQKNNSVLIVIAIIGVVGTLVASTIGVVGNYNIEKFRQEAELTRMALVSIATQGGATQISMAGTISAPTDTPYPTNEPLPTYTPYPTYTLVPLPTISPTPSVTLPFQDNFDSGLSKAWLREGGDWHMANGKVANGSSTGILWLGKANWTDLVIEFDLTSDPYVCSDWIQILTHMQDPYNFVAVGVVGCYHEGIYLYKDSVQTIELVQGPGGRGSHWKIEIIGSLYRVTVDGKLRETVSDETFASGSVGIQMGKQGSIGNFSISPYSP